jgi:hypothetical protein
LIVGSSDQFGGIRWHHFPHTHPFIRFDQLLKRLDDVVEATDDQLDMKKITANQQKRLRLLQQLSRSNAILREVKSLKRDLNALLEMDDQLSAWLYCLEVRNTTERDLSAGDLHDSSSIVARSMERSLEPLSSAAVFDAVLEEIRSSHGKLSLVVMRVCSPSELRCALIWMLTFLNSRHTSVRIQPGRGLRTLREFQGMTLRLLQKTRYHWYRRRLHDSLCMWMEKSRWQCRVHKLSSCVRSRLFKG